ncbi:MAG: methylenetetrahydrofolate--tRNA-(uracil(54)-C(5))-methyltransferase (FADH(2)-oxidizing) TrmFO [Candidatus Cloacimonetes bacterium]|nr:methylenetetrahydrofolate--tRNA-(uracil(54)-C(5))-methyltransferase (FADH(2)-oxidizing) TrmFO [Candidatus Cloacimonadota bacterium]MDD4157109.1 methylenetetrahydrofolate--tRNA-(uracil(54)-C(5))-methyltransferase (FADH(2)-oxidizing) TrmFO [Candidatus Cloacimonadota bacterium]
MQKINIIGAGLAGCELALQLADFGYDIDLYEMRPDVSTPAHKTNLFAELVCSNSLKSNLISTSSGLLKAEMDLLNCKLLQIAKECSVPAGNALAVDRDNFSAQVTHKIKNHSKIRVINQEFYNFTDDLTVLATGPLSSDRLIDSLSKVIGDEYLYFFDAIAPVVSKDSINLDIAFSKTRYDKGEADYINCPFNKDEYYRFVEALLEGEKYQAKEFENDYFQNVEFKYYENCMPIEELARRGRDTLRYGVMRPVGLENPNTGQKPYAVIQLRIENSNKTAYNLVGCQTMLKQLSQKQAFRLIPGLKNAEFVRYGSIHRNTYLNSPRICNRNLSLTNKPNIILSGQLSGVEGYTESIFSGLLTALIIHHKLKYNKDLNLLPETTVCGQLWRHLITDNSDNKKPFIPMNANFGLLPDVYQEKKNKKEKKELLASRAINDLKNYLLSNNLS